MLTPREKLILQHIFSGKNNSAIALALGISIQSVTNDLHAIYRKLEIHNIRELFPLVIASASQRLRDIEVDLDFQDLRRMAGAGEPLIRPTASTSTAEKILAVPA